MPEPWKDLASAILKQAIVDARSDSPKYRGEARRFLKSRMACFLAEGIDFEIELIHRWLAADCPSPEDSRSMFGPY